jgi:hypothetical protein
MEDVFLKVAESRSDHGGMSKENRLELERKANIREK